MALGKKKGLILLTSLLLGTFGLHAVYRAQAKVGPVHTPGGPLAIAKGTIGNPSAPVKVEGGDGSVRLTATVDRTAVLQRGDGLVHVEVSVKADARPGDVERTPTDVLVVLDHSGSMSGQKFEYAKQALLGLIDRLSPDDRLGVVTFSGSASTLIPLSSAGTSREPWRQLVRNLELGGGTNIGSGLDLALGMMAEARGERATRVLLLSDGQDNEGSRSYPALVQRARTVGAREGVLTTLGIGTDFDEHVMTSLASAGTGAFYYLSKLEVLPGMLDAELKTATATYARGAELRLRLGDGVRVASAGGLPIETQGNEIVIPLGSLYTARERKVWLTMNLPTATLDERELGKIALRYRQSDKTLEVPSTGLPKIACVADQDSFKKRIDGAVWGRAMLEEELTRAREELGDAIARGTASDVDKSVQHFDTLAPLAAELGQAEVAKEISELRTRGSWAKSAQLAPAPARNLAAKQEKATGYGRRNMSSYNGTDWQSGF